MPGESATTIRHIRPRSSLFDHPPVSHPSSWQTQGCLGACKVITLHRPNAGFPYQAQFSLLDRSCTIQYCPMDCSRKIERNQAASKVSGLMSTHSENWCKALCRQLSVCNISECVTQRLKWTDIGAGVSEHAAAVAGEASQENIGFRESLTSNRRCQRCS